MVWLQRTDDGGNIAEKCVGVVIARKKMGRRESCVQA
jgi:hypothetical protein